MEFLNQFHKESTERTLRKMQEWKKQPMSATEAAAEMWRNYEMALEMEMGEEYDKIKRARQRIKELGERK